jgi:ribosomal protein S18 acetylase RimI-like enzyme
MLTYRRAELTDAKGIADLHAESWRRTYRGDYRDEFLDGDVFAERRSVWNRRLSEPVPNQFVAVAVDDSRILGFVCAFGAHDPKWGSLIDNLHVDEGAKRRGIGASLMRQAGTWLSQTFPSAGVYLEVLESNRRAQAFYQRLGGRDVGTMDSENPGGGTSRHFLYAWDSPNDLLDRTKVWT